LGRSSGYDGGTKQAVSSRSEGQKKGDFLAEKKDENSRLKKKPGKS
jgi:hypothetical protein